MFGSTKLRVGLSVAGAIVLVAVLGLAILAARGFFTHASSPTPITITDQLAFGHPPRGSFQASAAVCSSGTFVDDVQVPATGPRVVRETFTCIDDSGTFTIKFNAAQVGESVPWSVLSGTKAYATLRGSGNMSLVQTGSDSATVTFTGTVHFG